MIVSNNKSFFINLDNICTINFCISNKNEEQVMDIRGMKIYVMYVVNHTF